MKRLTTNTPKDNYETALNLFYIKDQWAWVRGGGPAPDYPDVSLCDYIRLIAKAHIPDAELPEDDEECDIFMCEMLFDEPETVEGLIATLYTAGWAFASLRGKLMQYEDTGLSPEDIISAVDKAKIACALHELNDYKDLGSIDHIRDLLHAEKDGRLVVLPCGENVELERDGCTFKADHWNHSLTAFRDAPETPSGKKVALFSIAEATVALAGKGGAKSDKDV